MPIEIALKAVIIYVLIVLGIRLFGKREIAQLSITDLVFILLISNAVQAAMIGGNTTLIGGIIAGASLFVVNYLFGLFSFKSKKFTHFLQGHPLLLIYEGRQIQDNVNKAQISQEELEAAVREHGVEKIDQVDLAILEIDGNISVLSNNFKVKTVRRRHGHKVVEKVE